jgi:hypothetical protein
MIEYDAMDYWRNAYERNALASLRAAASATNDAARETFLDEALRYITMADSDRNI